MDAVRLDVAAASVLVAATRPAWRSQAPLFEIAVSILQQDGGRMSAGEITK
jgi:hypothetical protein